MSAKRITRVSRADLDELEDRTDWDRVDRLTEEEITAAAASDPDTVDPDDPWWQRQLCRGGVVVPPGIPKKRVSLRLDEDVIAWFRKDGRGYHHLVNHALRRYMQDEERSMQDEERRRQEAAAAE
jgi:uncharacterized protein (DUF4415 family)